MGARANEREIRCDCGKLLAIERDGKVYIQCHRCKNEILIGLALPQGKQPSAPERVSRACTLTI